MKKQEGFCILNSCHTREKRCVHKFQKRAGFTDKHHLRPGKETVPSNLLEMDAYRHDAWHFFFYCLTINEVIYLLRCLKRTKKSIFSNMNEYEHDAWNLLFKNKTLTEAIELLVRVKRIKENVAKRSFKM